MSAMGRRSGLLQERLGQVFIHLDRRGQHFRRDSFLVVVHEVGVCRR